MNTKGYCYPKSIILQTVYFKLRFTLSYWDVEEIMKMRGIQVDHTMLRKNQMFKPDIGMFKSFYKLAV
jgi:putative transposase